MTTTTLSVILTIVGLLFGAWWKINQAKEASLVEKNEDLEAAADRARQEEAAENEDEAKKITASGDRTAGIGFLRGSFRPRS